MKLFPESCFPSKILKTVDQTVAQIDQKCDVNPNSDPKKLDCHVVFEVERGNFCKLYIENGISSRDVQLFGTKVEHIHCLVISFNTDVQYLPVSNDYISHLIEYQAIAGGIKAIFKENFAKMKWLKVLLLNGNKITTIASDTFTGLQSLEMLELGKVKIKMK